MAREEASLLTARYATFPRSGWLAIALALLSLAAAIKLAVTGHLGLALYPFAGALCALAWPVAAHALVGTVVLTPSTLRLVRRVGGREIPRADITDVRLYGRRKTDTAGVELVLDGGRRIALKRLEPSAVQTLLALHAKR